MPARLTLKQISDAARAICATCEHHRSNTPYAIDCAHRDTSVRPYRDQCPDRRWDHSELPPAESNASTSRDLNFVYVCFGHHLKWACDAWDEIKTCPLVEGKFKVPRAMYDRIKDQRLWDD